MRNMLIFLIPLTIFNILIWLFFVYRERSSKRMQHSYTIMRMFIRDVNFKTATDLIRYFSNIYKDVSGNDIYCIFKNVYLPAGTIEFFKNGTLVAKKKEIEAENEVSSLNRIVLLSNVSFFVNQEKEVFSEIGELLKLLFTAAINYDFLYTQAGTDQLTQLHNRLALDTYTSEIYPILMETGRDVSFVMMDVDEFKKFNDTYGHDIGDVILQRVAGAIKKNIKASDFPFRFGGDEMAIIVEGDEGVTEKIVSRIRSTLAESSRDYSISISVGIATAKKGEAFETMRRKADEKLYNEKNSKKKEVTV